jgi:chorismate synthase
MSRLRWMTAGESHGPRLVALVEGFPAARPLLASAIDEPRRPRRGCGRGGRMKIETDRVELGGGVRDGDIRPYDALFGKLGGDSLREPVRNVAAYRVQIEAF